MGYTPNEIAIFHRDNDQQNHWVFWGTQHFQTKPVEQSPEKLTICSTIDPLNPPEFGAFKNHIFRKTHQKHGSLNVPIFHITQPLGINGLLDGYYKVMSNIPKSWDIYQPLKNDGRSAPKFIATLSFWSA